MPHAIVGLGMDIVAVARIADILDKHGDSFAKRQFTDAERAYCEDGRGPARAQRYAARFAAKEACAKALGTGIGQHAGWREIEVVRTALADGTADGPPTIRLSGSAAATAKALGVTGFWLTLAHEREAAVATVLLVRDE